MASLINFSLSFYLYSLLLIFVQFRTNKIKNYKVENILCWRFFHFKTLTFLIDKFWFLASFLCGKSFIIIHSGKFKMYSNYTNSYNIVQFWSFYFKIWNFYEYRCEIVKFLMLFSKFQLCKPYEFFIVHFLQLNSAMFKVLSFIY